MDEILGQKCRNRSKIIYIICSHSSSYNPLSFYIYCLHFSLSGLFGLIVIDCRTYTIGGGMNNPQLQNKNTGSDTVPKGKKPLPRNPTNKPTMKEEKIDEKKGDEGEDEVSLLGLGGADEENNKKDRTPGSDGEFDGGQRRQQEIIDRWESDCKYTAVTTTLSNQKMILQGWISTMEASFKETARRISLLKGPKTDPRVEASTCRIIFEVISKIMEYDRGFRTMVLFDIFPAMNEIMAQLMHMCNSRLGAVITHYAGK
jgi:hypothetical protein